MRNASSDPELSTLAAYVPETIGGDEAAWKTLAARLEPPPSLEEVASELGHFGDQADD
jgi:hypothetical protein